MAKHISKLYAAALKKHKGKEQREKWFDTLEDELWEAAGFGGEDDIALRKYHKANTDILRIVSFVSSSSFEGIFFLRSRCNFR